MNNLHILPNDILTSFFFFFFLLLFFFSKFKNTIGGYSLGMNVYHGSNCICA
jgi:hypothetical protein